MTRYSQNDEEDALLRFFGDFKGRLLDIGAYDGRTFSNSRKLLQLGWNGVLVEPDPFNLVRLLTDEPPNTTVVFGAVVGTNGGLRTINIERYPDRGWASSLFYSEQGGRIMSPLRINCITCTIPVGSLVPLGPFDFKSIDADGLDLEIIRSAPPELFQQCKCVCAEPKGPEERELIKDHFAAIGFSVFHETPENVMVAR